MSERRNRIKLLAEMRFSFYASSCLYTYGFNLDYHLLGKHDDTLFLQKIASQIPSLSSASFVKWLPSSEPEDTFMPTVRHMTTPSTVPVPSVENSTGSLAILPP